MMRRKKKEDRDFGWREFFDLNNVFADNCKESCKVLFIAGK